MLFNTIKIGDRLEITILKDHKTNKSYVSQVEDVIDENEVMIHVPISYGQLVKLSTREEYSILFFTEKGMARFDAEITEYVKENEFNFMKVKLLTDGERIQRREFFRFNCLLPLKFDALEESINNNEKHILHDGIIKDLGGGGVRFVSNESVIDKGRMRCVIMLDDECLVLIGKVLHKQHFPKSNYKYQYRIQFVGISQGDQEKIVQYIFNEQRKVMQKSRI